MATSTSKITTTLTNSPVNEGAYAIATFKLTPTLSIASKVKVNLAGWGTTTADFTGLEFSQDGSNWSSIANDVTLTLAAGLSSFKLRTFINPDSLTNEVGESVNFTVSQIDYNSGLVDSYYVSATFAINDTTGTSAGGQAAQQPPLRLYRAKSQLLRLPRRSPKAVTRLWRSLSHRS